MRAGLYRTNRVVALLLGVLLLVLGLATVLWCTGTLARLWPRTPDSIETAQVGDVTTAPWWTAVAAVVGIVLLLLGLWWLLSHLRTTRVGRTALPGSDGSGRLTLELPGVARHFATLAGRQNGVTAARATFVTERGRTVLSSAITVDAEADLDAVSRALADLTAQARDVAGIPRFAARTRLHVSRRHHDLDRVV